MSTKKPSVTQNFADLAEKMTSRAESAASIPRRPRTDAAGASGVGGLVQFSEQFKELHDEVEQLRSAKGRAETVALAQIDDNVDDATPMDEARIERLVQNLRENPLLTPLVVWRKDDGRYGLIAGRHRREALRRLGHEQVDVVVRQVSENDRIRLTFFDNLLAPNLTDYARYLGFEALRSRLQMTTRDMATASGLAVGTVSDLMAFKHLGAAALEIVAAHPDPFTFMFVRALRAAELNDAEQLQVLRAVAEDGKKPMAALAAAVASRKPVVARPTVQEVRVGRARFASVTRRDRRIVLDVKSDWADPALIEARILEVLRELSAQGPSSTSESP